MALQLGKCYEFTLASGKIVRLKFLGGNPLRWQTEECTILEGPLDAVLSEPMQSPDPKEIPCWECP